MDKKNIIILRSIVLIILLILIISIILFINYKQSDEMQSNSVEKNMPEYEPTKQVIEEKKVSTFIAVNNCVNKYLNYINESNTYGVYSLLIEDYIKKNNINENNVIDSVEKINFNNEYKTEKLYKYDQQLNFETYFVFGKIINKDEKSISESNYILTIDNTNMTFEIAPYGKVFEEYVNYSDKNNIVIDSEKFDDKINNIEKNEYNEAPITIGIRR